MTNINIKTKLEKVSMGHGCPRLLFLFHLQFNIGYTISEYHLHTTRDVKSCQIRHPEVRIRYPDTSEGSHRIASYI